MTYEREPNWAGKAIAIIRDRIRRMPAYSEAREIVLSAALGQCKGRSVQEMRRLGGFSKVIDVHISNLPERFRTDFGSTFFPTTVITVLRDELPQLRAELQLACASQPCN